MKKLLLCTSALLLTSSLSAKSGDFFAGLNFGKADLSFKVEAASSATASDDASHKTLEFGYYFTKDDAVSISKSFINENTNQDIDFIAINYKHLFNIQNKVNFLLGASYSMLDYKESGLKAIDSNFGKDSIEINSKILSANIGLNFSDISKNLDAEFGYRFEVSNSGDDSISYNGTNVNVSTEDVNIWYVGVNYRF